MTTIASAPVNATKRTSLIRAGSTSPFTLVAPGFEGVTQTTLVGADQGSVHQEVAIVEIAPGGMVPGHLHPYEESFFVLDGEALFAVNGETYALRPGDYGFAPVAAPHAWRNRSSAPVRLLQCAAPQPKQIGVGRGTYAATSLEPPVTGRTVVLQDPTCRFVGHFELDQMSPYGPIAAKGVTNYCIKHISTRLLVEETLGAIQHITFMAQLPPSPTTESGVRDLMEADPLTKTHYHPYEEVYYFFGGRGLAFLDGERFEVGAGDTVLAATGGSHSVINIGAEPLRWLETQAPRPPDQNGAYWEKDWAALEPLIVSHLGRPTDQ